MRRLKSSCDVISMTQFFVPCVLLEQYGNTTQIKNVGLVLLATQVLLASSIGRPRNPSCTAWNADMNQHSKRYKAGFQALSSMLDFSTSTHTSLSTEISKHNGMLVKV